MLKFAHLADCHLGGWRQQELQDLNFQSFQRAIELSIQKKPDFILIAGDLFDSAYPPIEILKKTFAEFRKIKNAKIPVYIIAGSHDFSASGKTFLDVLEHAGFCKNIEDYETKEGEDKMTLKPHIHENNLTKEKIALYGYSGKKSGMEIEDLKKIKFESIHPFTILMLHTTIKDVVGTIPMEYLEKESLPLADYYALGHIHQRFDTQEQASRYVYPGPTFPNNFQELADLQTGSFNLVELENGKLKTQNIKITLKDIAYVEIEIENALTATEQIIKEIDKQNLLDKLVLLKLKGTIKKGKTGDIKFEEIEEFVRKKQAYIFLRNISALKVRETEIEIDTENVENVEEAILEDYTKNNPSDFNKFLPQLINSLSIEKNEDEKSIIFENRLIDDLKKILNIGDMI